MAALIEQLAEPATPVLDLLNQTAIRTAELTKFSQRPTMVTTAGIPAVRLAPVVGIEDRTKNRVALVIGNATYRGGIKPSVDACRAAAAVAARLRQTGFSVAEKCDATAGDLRTMWDEFHTAIRRPYTLAVFVYAGHGVQIEGEEFLLPVDFVAPDGPWRSDDVRRTAFSVNTATAVRSPFPLVLVALIDAGSDALSGMSGK